MPRYKADLHSIIRNGHLSRKHFLIVARQTIDVLQHLHQRHYVHSDIKSENIMIGLYEPTTSKSTSNSLNGFSKKSSIPFSGANPFRHCRVKDGNVPDKSHHTVYNDMVQSHYSIRPGRSNISYALDDNSRSSHALDSYESNDDSYDEDFAIGSKGEKFALFQMLNIFYYPIFR